MKSLPIEIISLSKIVGGGQAIGDMPDGRKVFVWGGLPGETVKVQLTKLKKSYGEGFVTEVINPSRQRIEPRDKDAYLATSPWQIMNFQSEQSYKSDLIREAFSLSHINLDIPIKVVTDNKEFYYRNKMEYSLWWDHDTNKISLAFHKRGSHVKTPIFQSSIEKPEIFSEATRVINELNRNGGEARRYQSLLVRASQTGEVESALFEKNQPHPKMSILHDKLLGQDYSYSPNGFFQINLPVYELALKDISRFIETDQVVDMYAGVGTIGLSVAPDKQLALVETNASAFSEMKNNLPKNSEHIQAIQAKSEDALEYISEKATIIVDPPRAGLDPTVVDKLIETLPPRIIYLSCNPITQARDIKPMLDYYKIVHLKGYNFFPRTPHIENLIVLDRIS